MNLLDYTNSGSSGEPEVVYVDEEDDFKKTFLAKDFETFAPGLVHGDLYDTPEQGLADALQAIRNGQFSDILQEYFQKDKSLDFERILATSSPHWPKQKVISHSTAIPCPIWRMISSFTC